MQNWTRRSLPLGPGSLRRRCGAVTVGLAGSTAVEPCGGEENWGKPCEERGQDALSSPEQLPGRLGLSEAGSQSPAGASEPASGERENNQALLRGGPCVHYFFKFLFVYASALNPRSA